MNLRHWPSTLLRSPTLVLLLMVMLALIGNPSGDAFATAASPIHIHVLAFNDFHGRLDAAGAVQVPDASGKPVGVPAGGAAWLAAALHARAAKEPLNVVVAAGDLVGASPFVSAHFHDEPTIDALNQMGLEFSAPGNHEFDRGVAELMRLQHGGCALPADGTSCAEGSFGGAKFEYLAANVEDRQSGKSLFPASAVKLFDTGDGHGVRLGFIGLDTVTTASISAQGARQAVFRDEADSANAEAKRLRARGVNAIIVLIHQGGVSSGSFNDKSCPDFTGDLLPILDRLDPGLRVIVSGHTHQVYNCRRNGRLVTSAGAYGHYLTDIDLTVDPLHDTILSADADNIVVANDSVKRPADRFSPYPAFPADAGIAALVAAADARAAPLASRTIAHLAAPIFRDFNDAGESPLGDVIADAQLAASSTTGAQVSLLNAGAIRDDLRETTVSYAEAFGVQPFGDALVTLTLTGAQLRQVLEEAVGSSERPRPLQVSQGFTYAWSAAAPVGKRVPAASLKFNGKAVGTDDVLRVVVNDFMAAGGDRLFTLKAGTHLAPGPLALDALIDFLAGHPPSAGPSVLDRIQRLP